VIEPVPERQCSFGIRAPLMVDHPKLTSEPLLVVPYLMVASPRHPLASYKRAIPASDLSRHVQLVLTDRSRLTDGKDLRVLSPKTWRLSDLGAKHAFLKAGLGWGGMPLHVVEADLKTGDLVPLTLLEADSRILMSMSAIYRTDTPPGPAGRWLIDRLKQSAEASPDRRRSRSRLQAGRKWGSGAARSGSRSLAVRAVGIAAGIRCDRLERPCLIGREPVPQARHRMKSFGRVAADRREGALHHLGQRVPRPEVQHAIDALLGNCLQSGGPVDGVRDLVGKSCHRIRCREDAFAAASSEEDPPSCDGRVCTRCECLSQGFTGLPEPRRVRGDPDSEKTGARGAVCCSLMAESDDILFYAPHHENKIGVPDRDLAAVLFKQGFQRMAIEPADIAEAAIGAGDAVHQARASSGQSQGLIGGPYPSSAPGGHLADAIAADGRRFGQEIGHAGMDRKRRCDGQDLADLIGGQLVCAVRPDEIPWIFAEIPGCRGENRLCGRLVGGQIEDPVREGALSTAKEGQHQGSSRSTNRAMASRSAEPPGLRLRATKAW